jgi:4-hydroxy-4-methyl-2-oxoglutarate aldolase
MIHIKHQRPVVSETLIQGFFKHAAATVHEAMGRRGALDFVIKPVSRGMKICGRALTVQCHAGDNIMLIKAVSMAQRGDVIVMDAGEIVQSGAFGEVLATECVVRGMAGLVTSASVRDSEALTRLGFPVFSAGLSICGTVKATLGTINHRISCGGVIVNPGDIILGDDDGVVVIPLDKAETTLQNANQRVAKENKVMEQLRAGGSLFEIYGYNNIMERLGSREEKL